MLPGGEWQASGIVNPIEIRASLTTGSEAKRRMDLYISSLPICVFGVSVYLLLIRKKKKNEDLMKTEKEEAEEN